MPLLRWPPHVLKVLPKNGVPTKGPTVFELVLLVSEQFSICKVPIRLHHKSDYFCLLDVVLSTTYCQTPLIKKDIHTSKFSFYIDG